MNFSDELITVCPACGFSFRAFNSKTRKKIKKCPMCGSKIIEPEIFPQRQKDFKDPYFNENFY